MSSQPYDRSSKWLLEQFGRAILYLGGARGVRSTRALQPEIVQPKQLPDGLLEVLFADEKRPDLFLVEMATYPERRLRKQVTDDLTLAYQHFRRLPEVLVLILAERGRPQTWDRHRIRSRLGWSQIDCSWNVVELWKLSANHLLAAGDVGLLPWVPLCQYQGPLSNCSWSAAGDWTPIPSLLSANHCRWSPRCWLDYALLTRNCSQYSEVDRWCWNYQSSRISWPRRPTSTSSKR